MGRGLDGLIPVCWFSCAVLKVRGAQPRPCGAVHAPGGGAPAVSTGSGGFGVGETPLPIPNRAVKPHSADGTWPSRARESRSPPVYLDEPPSGGSSSLSGVVPDSSAVGEATLVARPAVRLWRPGEGMRRGARARAAARGSRAGGCRRGRSGAARARRGATAAAGAIGGHSGSAARRAARNLSSSRRDELRLGGEGGSVRG